MLRVDKLHFSYPFQDILKDLSLELEQGELLSISGPSGCGKSTLLYCLAGFIKPSSGTIQLNQRMLFENKELVVCEQRNIGVVFQDFCLFPHLNTRDNIKFGLSKLSKQEQSSRVLEVASLSNIEDLLNKFPHQLSGGQKQRVAIARAIAPKPELLLLDEAFSNLDADLKVCVIKNLRNMLKELNISTLLITHDNSEAESFGDRLLDFSLINQ